MNAMINVKSVMEGEEENIEENMTMSLLLKGRSCVPALWILYPY